MEDSIPEKKQGAEEHSLEQSADIVDEGQSSNEDDNQFWTTEETQEDEEEATEDGAPSQTQESDDDTESEDENSEEGVDPELTKWATSQNISLETPTEIALAKRLRDTQKSLHEKSAEAKKKFAEANSETTEGSDTARIKARLDRYDFFEEHPDAKKLEGEMYDYAVSVRDSGDTEGFKYFQTPKGWKNLYAIVKAEQAEVQSEDSFNAGRKDERKNLAKKQQAKSSSARAINSAPADNKMTDDKIAAMSLPEYNRYRAEHPEFNPFG